MKKCTIIYVCSEDCGAGSSPTIKAYPFTNDNLKNEFISKWNIIYRHLEKHESEPNKYFGSGDWVYWLEIKDGYINSSQL